MLQRNYLIFNNPLVPYPTLNIDDLVSGIQGYTSNMKHVMHWIWIHA